MHVTIFPADEHFRTVVQWRDPADGLLHERSFFTLDEADRFAAEITTTKEQ